MKETIELLREFGLGIFLSISILMIAWYLLRETIKSHEKERNLWMKMVDTHFQGQQNAHEHQRVEHNQMLDNLKETALILRTLNGK